MKAIKKIMMTSAICIGVLNCMTNIMASQKTVSHMQENEYGFKATSEFYTTTPEVLHTIPQVRLYQQNRSDGTYLCINVNETNA